MATLLAAATVAGPALPGRNIGKKPWRGKAPPIKARMHKSLPFRGGAERSETGGV